MFIIFQCNLSDMNVVMPRLMTKNIYIYRYWPLLLFYLCLRGATQIF